jgi:co-chaperonin GroES (HSP10)
MTFNLDMEELSRVLPKPMGYKVLIAVPTASRTFGGNIVKADSTVQAEEILSLVGLVLELGPEAYKDKARFPSGEAYCKVGDYIMMRTYTGTRFKIKGNEFRLINDDSVEAVVPEPSAISRVA